MIQTIEKLLWATFRVTFMSVHEHLDSGETRHLFVIWHNIHDLFAVVIHKEKKNQTLEHAGCLSIAILVLGPGYSSYFSVSNLQLCIEVF